MDLTAYGYPHGAHFLIFFPIAIVRFGSIPAVELPTAAGRRLLRRPARAEQRLCGELVGDEHGRAQQLEGADHRFRLLRPAGDEHADRGIRYTVYGDTCLIPAFMLFLRYGGAGVK